MSLGIAGLGTVGAGLLQPAAEARRPGWRETRRARAVRSPASRARTRDKNRGVDLAGIALVRRAERAGRRSVDRRVRRADRRRGRPRQGGGRGGAARPASTSSPPTRRCSPSTAPSWRSWPRRTASRSTSRRRWPAASPSSRRCARRWPAIEIRRVYGILNGTCNYILTQMQEEHRSFADVLKEAQAQGLRRGRSDLRHRRLRHRAQAGPADQPGVRHRASRFDQIHVEGIEGDHAGRHRGRRRPRLSHQAAGRRAADRERHRAARASRPWSRSTRPSPRCRASPTASPSTAISPATCCWSAPAPAPGRRPRAVAERHPRHRARRQSLPPFVRAGGQAEALQARQARPASGRLLRAPLGVRPAGRHGRHRRAHGRARGLAREHRAAPAALARCPASTRRPKPGAPTPVILITHETTEEAIRGALEAIEQRRQGVRAAADDTHRAALEANRRAAQRE